MRSAADAKTGGATIFFSYAHEDEDLRERLEVHLSSLRREGMIEQWHDRLISPGTPIDDAIDRQLDVSDIILLLVSANFLASEYCWGREVKRAMERHARGEARVIPVILKPVDWTGAPFSSLLALPKDGKAVTTWSNADEAFESIATGIRKAVSELVRLSDDEPGVAHDDMEARRGLEVQRHVEVPSGRPPSGASGDEILEFIRAGKLASRARYPNTIGRLLGEIESGNLDAARATIVDALRSAGDDGTTLKSLVDIANEIPELSDLAARLYVRLIDLEPTVMKHRRNLAVALAGMGEYRLALPFMEQLVDADPENADYVELLAQTLSNSGRHSDAYEFSVHALKEFPRSSWLFQTILDSGRRIGKTFEEMDAAAAEFLSGPFDGPLDEARARIMYANFLGREDHDKEALEEYERAFALGEPSSIARGNYAVELAAVGRDDDAEREFVEAIRRCEIDREARRIRRQYVNFLRSRGRKSEAAKIALDGIP